MCNKKMLTNKANIQDANRSGSNQIGIKQLNERLILDIISKGGQLSKAEITRITGLSAQTVTTIVNRLIKEGLVRKGEIVKGKIGQPSTLIELDNNGANAIGIKIGRRSADILLVGLAAKIAKKQSLQYDYPNVKKLFSWIGSTVSNLISGLPKSQRTKFIGIGIAAPFELDGWEGVIKAPKGEMSRWKNIDIVSKIENLTKQKTLLLNDATAACLAELTIAGQQQNPSFLYFYVGTFLGGGIVLDGKIYDGLTGNAGSVGSMPTSLATGVKPAQMVNAAAINELENLCVMAGLPGDIFGNEDALSEKAKTIYDDWSSRAANALAYAIISGQSFFDLNEVIIDGSIRRDLLNILIDKTEKSFKFYDTQGLKLPLLRAGNLGNEARAMGGSLLPLQKQFGLDQSLILKSSLDP